jgi:hypothetical protein
MTTPVLIRENYRTQDEMNRAVRDAVNGLLKAARQYGATAGRPPAPFVNQRYYDTTLNKEVVWNGSAWKDHSGATA